MTLKAFVTYSTLSEEDKGFWFSILESLDDAQIKIFEDFIGGKEENLKKLTDNLKAKRKAFENLDEKALEKILTSEQ
ncbi:MAG: hypothetical protein Q7S34_00435 [bacterium]|nr:hypothetical protein [bacterium]